MRTTRCAPTRWTMRSPKDRAAGLTPAIVTSTIGTTGTGAGRSRCAHRRRRERGGHVAPRRCCVGRLRDVPAGAASPPSGHRSGRTPTRSTHTSGCSRTSTATSSGSRSGAADLDPLDPPAVPAKRGERVRRSHRLPRLARPARPPLSSAQALVGASALRGGGIRHHIAEHLRLAAEFARRVDDEPALRRIAPVHFSLVCSRTATANEATDALVAAINATPSLYVTPSRVDDRLFIRVAVGQTRTSAENVDQVGGRQARAREGLVRVIVTR